MNIRPFLISNIRTETQLVQSFPAGYQKEKMSDYSSGYLSGEAGEVLLVGSLHLPLHLLLPHTLLLQEPVHLDTTITCTQHLTMPEY